MTTNWIDFKLLKRATLLHHYRIFLTPSGAHALRGACPLPTHSSTSPERSFIVNTNKNVWSCHSQSCIQGRDGVIGGNILDLVALIEGCSLRSAALLIRDWFGERNSTTEAPMIRPKSSQETGNAVLTFRLTNLGFDHPYLKQHGI